ncbi:MAG: MopE-related protein [Polyangiaceae bacterium]
MYPVADTCNGLDDDCNGLVDDADLDGDGWTECEGDCWDADDWDAQWVNPGAFEVPGNGKDDDCNPTTPDDADLPTCSVNPLVTPTSALALVKAMDLCQFTIESPPSKKDKTWGVVSASLSLADGSTNGMAPDVQVGVLADYGTFVKPQYGLTMAALSSGTARDESDPGFVYPQNGFVPEQIGNFVAGTAVSIPTDFLAGNGGQVPSACGACQSPACFMAFDSVALNIKIRVPTNASGFRVTSRMYTAEYPENTCSEFNDFFVGLVQTGAPGTPPDHNTALDETGNPLSANNAFFKVCGYPDCPSGSMDLVGTGMGGWQGVLLEGAATDWYSPLTEVVPGEKIQIRFAIWDAIDGKVDSTVLLDSFRWQEVELDPQP